MSTKIINVLKSDTFEEVFDLFKNVEAEEVIFIFPKGSRFAKGAGNFETIALEAERSGRAVSVMTSDPAIIQIASENNLEILNPPTRKHSVGAVAASSRVLNPAKAEKDLEIEAGRGSEDRAEKKDYYPQEEINFFGNIDNHASDVQAETDGVAEAVLASAGSDMSDRQIRDVVSPEYKKDIQVRGERPKIAHVDIKSSPVPNSSRRGDIAKIWAEREHAQMQSGRSGRGQPGVRRIFSSMPAVLVLIALAIIFAVAYFLPSSATIKIRPRKESFDTSIKVSSSTDQASVNVDFNKIPGQKFTEQKEEIGSFPVSGYKEVAQKASGKITIFNKSFQEQRLVATTRFRSPSGLVFRIPQTLTVPAAKKVGSEMLEGSIESIVYADRPGEEYNIEPGRFVVPGFEGSPRFEEFYAVSSQPMSGGLIGPAKVVTEEDMAKAQETINAKLRESILTSLSGRAPGLKVINSVLVKIEATVPNAKVGEAADELILSVKGSAEIIAFRESDVVELIGNHVSQSGTVELIVDSLKLEYADPEISSDGKSMIFNVKFNGKAAAKISQDKVIVDISGMKEDTIQVYFKNSKEIESARIVISPFWAARIPRDKDRIKIELDLTL